MLRFIHFALLFFVGVSAAQAQKLINPGFENWVPAGISEEPEGWLTVNRYSSPFVAPGIFKSTDAHSGNYSMELHNIPRPDTGMINGQALFASTASGVRYKSLRGWYKLTQAADDSAVIVCGYFKKLPSGELELTAGNSLFFLNSAEWKPFVVPLTSFGGALPADSFIIWVAASAKMEASDTATRLYIDDLSLGDTIVNVPQANYRPRPSVSVYPNPARSGSLIQITHDRPTPSGPIVYELYDMSGRLLAKETSATGANSAHSGHQMKMPAVQAGIYLLKVEMPAGISTIKMLVE